jgi:hypothetical protein
MAKDVRQLRKWECDVVSEDGRQAETMSVMGHWDPNHQLTNETVSMAARAQAFVITGRKTKFQAVSEPKLVS